MMGDYNLSFFEAIEKCLQNNEFIVGEHFKKGVYAKNSDGVIFLMEIDEAQIFHRVLDNLIISQGLLNQKFKTIVCANAKTLGLK